MGKAMDIKQMQELGTCREGDGEEQKILIFVKWMGRGLEIRAGKPL